MPKLPSSLVALSLESSLLRIFLNASPFAALPLRTKDVDIPYFVQNLLFALLAYMESYIHKLLLHADTVLQMYALIECLERDVLDEGYAVCYADILCPGLCNACRCVGIVIQYFPKGTSCLWGNAYNFHSMWHRSCTRAVVVIICMLVVFFPFAPTGQYLCSCMARRSVCSISTVKLPTFPRNSVPSSAS